MVNENETFSIPLMPAIYNTWDRAYVYQQGVLDGFRLNIQGPYADQMRRIEQERDTWEQKAKRAECKLANYQLGIRSLIDSRVPALVTDELMAVEAWARSLLKMEPEVAKSTLEWRPQILKGEVAYQQSLEMDDDIPF